MNAPPPPTDTELLRCVVLRDEAALAGLYDRHSRLVYSVAMRVLRSHSDAEEVLQETFVRVWSRGSSYDVSLGAPAAWLTRIARNCAIDRVRARRVRHAVDAEPAATDGPAPEPSTSVTPDAVFEGHSTSVAVRGAVRALPTQQRTLIEAAFFEGYTHQELSERYAMPLGTVKARIRTGLLTLKNQLQAV